MGLMHLVEGLFVFETLLSTLIILNVVLEIVAVRAQACHRWSYFPLLCWSSFFYSLLPFPLLSCSFALPPFSVHPTPSVAVREPLCGPPSLHAAVGRFCGLLQRTRRGFQHGASHGGRDHCRQVDVLVFGRIFCYESVTGHPFWLFGFLFPER